MILLDTHALVWLLSGHRRARVGCLGAPASSFRR